MVIKIDRNDMSSCTAVRTLHISLMTHNNSFLLIIYGRLYMYVI